MFTDFTAGLNRRRAGEGSLLSAFVDFGPRGTASGDEILIVARGLGAGPELFDANQKVSGVNRELGALRAAVWLRFKTFGNFKMFTIFQSILKLREEDVGRTIRKGREAKEKRRDRKRWRTRTQIEGYVCVCGGGCTARKVSWEENSVDITMENAMENTLQCGDHHHLFCWIKKGTKSYKKQEGIKSYKTRNVSRVERKIPRVTRETERYQVLQDLQEVQEVQGSNLVVTLLKELLQLSWSYDEDTL